MIVRLARSAMMAATAVTALALPASAQLGDNLGSLTGDNAAGYLNPLVKGLSGTMNAAIFHTGRVPKQGFTLNIGARLMGVSFDDEDRSYTPSDPPGFTGTGPVSAPTVIGDTKSVSQPGQGGTTLYHPGGFDIGEFAFGAPQLTIGGFAGTQATVRWISIDIGDSDLGKFELFGIGAQHSISQYFEEMPIDLAAGVFYQNFKIDDTLIDAKTWHFNVTGSRQYGILQPYVGVGFDSIDMSSEYTDSGTSTRIAVDFDPESNFHLTLGSEANLKLLKLYGEVNFAARTGLAVGLSFGN
jgi:hypothetical protein